ncbi:FAD-dependent monooxygenase [Alcaligenes faecalis]|uniref:FAD-dependent monooxygenase n=1 Tax=Alcaligenes faecalis TaxID=511 RepID=A0ABY7N320_ALCFA|nr:FAD-dependent monooxygenase [Alcaligenes faecalis]WBM38517.1 FAD-dependent monooxygenase [Alcaligenes faecalis]
MKNERIVVCGGALAGMASALGLRKAGFDVSILSPAYKPMQLEAGQYHPRVYAVSVASQRFLAQLGAWNLMSSQRISPVQAMEVHGDGGGCLNLHAWQDAQDYLAWIVESGQMEQALYQALQVFGVPWIEDRFERLEGNTIVTAGQKRISADLFVGADGARSGLRSAAGIEHQGREYGDAGLVAHFNVERPHQQVALQWFTGDLILALLPMPDVDGKAQVSMVWSVPQAQADKVLAMPSDEQAQYLQTSLFSLSNGRLGQLSLRSPVHGFPLTFERSGLVSPGVALVGDAAHRVHPLAGQGLNLGLGDIEALIKVLSERGPHYSVGDMRVLNRYKRARAEPIAAMRAATDGLYRLFAAPGAPASMLRNAGMQVVDRLPWVKRRLIAHAAGISPGALLF